MSVVEVVNGDGGDYGDAVHFVSETGENLVQVYGYYVCYLYNY